MKESLRKVRVSLIKMRVSSATALLIEEALRESE